MPIRPTPLLLLILDGWGLREAREHNAIAQARTPHWDALLTSCAHTSIETSGVGRRFARGADGQLRGWTHEHRCRPSRVPRLYPDRQSHRRWCVRDQPRTQRDTGQHPGCDSHHGAFCHPAVFTAMSSIFFAMVAMAASQSSHPVFLHVFLDGRDTPPQSAARSLEQLQELVDQLPQVQVATIAGRYYAMDRDQRWDRVERAYRAITHGEAAHTAANVLEALEAAYSRDQTDEFVEPTVIVAQDQTPVTMKPGDVGIFVNFRADRARELTSALVSPDFAGFERGAAVGLQRFVTFTEYQKGLPVEIAFPSEALPDGLGEILARENLRQLRIAETEKYAHVTFFLNGGREEAYPDESRILIPSPQVATYDLQPEMSAPELTRKLVAAIESGDFDVIVCNVANPDMVGHTGVFDAAVEAVEAVDELLGSVRTALEKVGGEMLLTSDHGNIELMLDTATGQEHTAHTTHPVPLVYLGRAASLVEGGSLRDIAPTMLALLELEQPPVMTGQSLVVLREEAAA